MKIRSLIVIGLIAFIAAQSASAEVTRFSREVNRSIWLECVNDYVDLSWTADVVITSIEKQDRLGNERTWMFTRSVRQAGTADYYGHRWSFRSHFVGTQHGSDESPDIEYHARDQNILIAEKDNGLGFNIILTTRWQIRIVDGEEQIFIIENTAKCFP
jgi:hypothetical protein